MIAIITLVTMGVLVIGPTVIRGINSHFKLWDDSIQDSYSDPMRKAPNNQGIPNNCVCEPDFQGAPGERCGASPCPVTQRLETKLCNPAGCGEGSGIVTQRCVDDPSCCDGYQDTDVCCLGSGPAPTNCPLGSRVTQRTCGGAGSQFSSRPDSADVGVDGNPSCVPRCLGQFASNEAAAQAEPSLPVICVDDDTGLPSTGLQQNPTGVGLPISLLGTGSNVCSHPPSPMPNNKCETYCLDNYHPQGNICVADCSCPEGEYYQGTGAGDCGAGNVYQGVCPAGYYMVPPQACNSQSTLIPCRKMARVFVLNGYIYGCGDNNCGDICNYPGPSDALCPRTGDWGAYGRALDNVVISLSMAADGRLTGNCTNNGGPCPFLICNYAYVTPACTGTVGAADITGATKTPGPGTWRIYCSTLADPDLVHNYGVVRFNDYIITVP